MLQPRNWLRFGALAVTLLGCADLTRACSPMLLPDIAALTELQQGEPAFFSRIVLAEVVSVRASGRSAELNAWHQEVVDVLAAAPAAEQPIDVSVPPPPPAVLPLLPSSADGQADVELLVVETIVGGGPERLHVPSAQDRGGGVFDEHYVAQLRCWAHHQRANSAAPSEACDPAAMVNSGSSGD